MPGLGFGMGFGAGLTLPIVGAIPAPSAPSLVTETSDHLLLEDGSRILLES